MTIPEGGDFPSYPQCCGKGLVKSTHTHFGLGATVRWNCRECKSVYKLTKLSEEEANDYRKWLKEVYGPMLDSIKPSLDKILRLEEDQ